MINSYLIKYRSTRVKNLFLFVSMIILIMVISFILLIYNTNLIVVLYALSMIFGFSLFTIVVAIKATTEFLSLKEMEYYIMTCETMKELNDASIPCNIFIRSCIFKHKKRRKEYNRLYNIKYECIKNKYK